jgi:phenylacetate-CoA ligase
MRAFAYLRDIVFRRSVCKAAANLANLEEDEFFKGQADRVLMVLRHAQKNVPGYREILDDRGIDTEQIQSIPEFEQHIPVLDKRTWFGRKFTDICVASRIPHIATFYSSSGQTGFFSLGTETRSEQRNAAVFLEFAFQRMFAALEKKTFLINCLPMGVRTSTKTIPVAETSVREDVVIALVKSVAEEFDQIILLGEHLFLKHVVEVGIAQGINWKTLCVHVVTGAEFIPEGFRTYLAELMAIDLADTKTGSVNINFGLSEISPSIGHENWHTIQIRRLAYDHAEFAKRLFGVNRVFQPVILQYNPGQFFLETCTHVPDRPELVVTVLDKERCIPIVRYNTGDHARTFSHSELSRILQEFGRSDLIPPVRLPGLLMWGKCRGFEHKSDIVFPEQIKEAIYARPWVAAALTGNFRIGPGSDAPSLQFQLREGVQESHEVKNALESACRCNTGVEVDVGLFAYEQFPYGLRHDFERKNCYVG